MANKGFIGRLRIAAGTALRALRLMVGLTLAGICGVGFIIGSVAVYERMPGMHSTLIGVAGIVAFVYITSRLADSHGDSAREGDEP